MQVITFMNEKGGVGKTTTATAIASLLAQSGKRICMIDTDTQGHVAERFKLKSENGFYALMQGQTWQNVLRPIAPDYYGGASDISNLWIVPGYDATRKLDNDLTASALLERLHEISEAFDFVIVDTSPKLGDIHAALYAASDYVIIPTECTRLSVKGVISTIDHIRKAAPVAERAGFKVAEILGIIPTKFDGKKSVHYQMLGWIEGRYGEAILFNPIRFLTDWEKAEALQKPIHVFNPRSAATLDARSLMDEISQRLGLANV